MVAFRTARAPILALGLTLALGGTATAQIQSLFTADAEGWVARDLNCSNYNSVLATHALTWQEAGGNPGAYVWHHDATNYCSFFAAPAAWLGDRSAYAGGSLIFSLTSTEYDWADSDVVVLIGAGLVICHELPHLPPQPPVWGQYIVPLVAGAFRYNNQSGAVVSAANFAAVLADLDALLLPAEFGAQVEETVGLDGVRLAPLAAAVPPAAAALALGAEPNPFNPSTRLVFTLPADMPVRLTVHDAAGRLVAVLCDGGRGVAGRNEVAWRGCDDAGRALPSGVYLARLEAAGVEATARVTLLR